MPAPSNANALTLGRPVIDIASIETMDDVRLALGNILRMLAGGGYAAAAREGDTQYQAVYARNIADEWFLYGGKPSDPENPDPITAPFSGSTSIAVQDEGAGLGSFDTINFVGDGVVAVDGGGGVATVTIDGGGGGGTPEEVIIYGIDPAGTHTIETSGTTLTIHLDLIKYTIDVTGITAQEADSLDIVYSDGEECVDEEV